MNPSRIVLRILRAVSFVAMLASASVQAPATPQANAPDTAIPVVRAEGRVVLVDAIVTDKKGKYLADLTAKEFRLWEDDKEQVINSFSVETDAALPESARRRYIVLFFDNSTMDFGNQAKVREAAAKFIDANAGPNRVMAVANFGGILQVTQNFTDNMERLKKVVAGFRTSSVSPDLSTNATLGAPVLTSVEGEFGAHSMLMALRSLSRRLSTIPGRKTLVLFSGGFPLDPQQMSELNATIAACNKANVAIYALDARGLYVQGFGTAAPLGMAELSTGGYQPAGFNPAGTYSQPHLVLAAFDPQGRPSGPGGAPTGPPGGGGPPRGGGGGPSPSPSPGPGPGPAPSPAPGGGTPNPGGGAKPPTGPAPAPRGPSGPTGPTGPPPGSNSDPSRYNPLPRIIIPEFPKSALNNQQVLYALAEGTGGFVITNTNGLLEGLQRIATDVSQYYVLGYTPAASAEGSCHVLRVKVERGGSRVRARSGYCNVKPVDLLAGKPAEQELARRIAGSEAATMASAMQTPYFFTAPNVARINLAMEIPSRAMKTSKENGKLHASVNVLGIAFKPDGTVGARFSDTVNLNFESKSELGDFQSKPMHYQKQFEVASGQYQVRVVFSSGGSDFGRIEAPLTVDAYDGKHFQVSAVALSNQTIRLAESTANIDQALLEDQTPLVVRGLQIIPSPTNRFKKSDKTVLYVEVYEPLFVTHEETRVAVRYRVLAEKSGDAKVDTGILDMTSEGHKGSPLMPLGLKVPLENLAPGAYTLEVVAGDSAGNKSPIRTVAFQVE